MLKLMDIGHRDKAAGVVLFNSSDFKEDKEAKK